MRILDPAQQMHAQGDYGRDFRVRRPLLSIGHDRRSATFRESIPASERPVREPLPEQAGHDREEPALVCVLPLVEAHGLLIEITEQVERLDRHVGALDGALQERPEVLQAVGVDLAAHVSHAMVDDAVDVFGLKTLVGPRGIGVNVRAWLDVLLNVRLKRVLPDVLGDGDADGGVLVRGSTLQQPHDRSLAPHAGSLDDALALFMMHEARAPADESLVGLHVAAELPKPGVLHRKPEPVEHEPSGLLGHAQVAGNFVGRDPVLAVDEHPSAGKPEVKADGGILEQSPDLGGELLLAAGTAPDVAGRDEVGIASLAAGANDAIRPAHGDEEVKCCLWVREVTDSLDQRFRDVLGLHGQKIRPEGLCVKYIVTRARVTVIEQVLGRPFLSRLRWLFTGKF